MSQSPQQPIVTLTLNPTLDVACSLDHVVPERKLRADDVRYEAGGGGINVTHAIANLGGHSTAVWTCGGHNGVRVAGILDESGWPHRPVPVTGETRESFHAFERATTLQYRFVLPGPVLTPAELDACMTTVGELLPEGGFLVVSGSLPNGVEADLYERICSATPANTKIIADTSGAALRGALRANVYLVKPNLNELSELVGRELDSDADITAAARELVHSGQTKAVVVSLGSGGALLIARDTMQNVRSPTVPIRSKVGAGDSMVAGITFSLACGRSLVDAVRFGVAAGAAAVMTDGTELCSKDDTMRLYESMTS